MEKKLKVLMLNGSPRKNGKSTSVSKEKVEPAVSETSD